MPQPRIPANPTFSDVFRRYTGGGLLSGRRIRLLRPLLESIASTAAPAARASHLPPRFLRHCRKRFCRLLCVPFHHQTRRFTLSTINRPGKTPFTFLTFLTGCRGPDDQHTDAVSQLLYESWL